MLNFQKINYSDTVLYLLHYDSEHFAADEFLNYLFPCEIEKLSSIRHPVKKIEYVAVRVLRSVYLGKEIIYYSDIGAPFINSGGFISISHAKGVVGLAYCKFYPIGLDLEPVSEKARRVKDKFLSISEKLTCDLESEEEMTKVWSGKEVLYKLSGRKKIIFAENLFLSKIADKKWIGRMSFNNLTKEVELDISKNEDFIISINTGSVYEI